MLKISVVESQSQRRVIMEGRLIAPWGQIGAQVKQMESQKNTPKPVAARQEDK
jgi:hypothetical protein